MNILREGAYLNLILGVATLSLGLMYATQSAMFAEMPLNIQMFLIWFSVGVLFILTGAVAMFEGAQTIMEGMRRKKEEDL